MRSPFSFGLVHVRPAAQPFLLGSSGRPRRRANSASISSTENGSGALCCAAGAPWPGRQRSASRAVEAQAGADRSGAGASLPGDAGSGSGFLGEILVVWTLSSAAATWLAVGPGSRRSSCPRPRIVLVADCGRDGREDRRRPEAGARDSRDASGPLRAVLPCPTGLPHREPPRPTEQAVLPGRGLRRIGSGRSGQGRRSGVGQAGPASGGTGTAEAAEAGRGSRTLHRPVAGADGAFWYDWCPRLARAGPGSPGWRGDGSRHQASSTGSGRAGTWAR